MLPEGEQQSIRARLIERGKAYFDLYKNPFSLWQYHGPVKLQSEFHQEILQGLTGKNAMKHNWVVSRHLSTLPISCRVLLYPDQRKTDARRPTSVSWSMLD